MSSEIPVFLTKALLILIVVSVAVANARPSHFGENNQAVSEQESNNNILDGGLKPWQYEQLLAQAQRLAELNGNDQDAFGFERALRSRSDVKRQSRYRLCYFNPVSCFKK
ncbi:uncharacterized protein LOC109608991 [Aethina tumida]|uniref:uncharacterized protein LOC109608991 n=1 Tax=Aethina tumida TaxID=116153 RepID=UPI00096AE563|nr:uncharacterized protein LOC109608991 [Aethina tumida]